MSCNFLSFYFLIPILEQKRMTFWYENVMDSVLIEPPLEATVFALTWHFLRLEKTFTP